MTEPGKDPLSADIERRLKKEQPDDKHKQKPHKADPQFWLVLVIALMTVVGLVSSIIGMLK